MFLGLDFFGDVDTFTDIPTNIPDITKVTLQNGIIDDVFITKDADILHSPTVDKTWNFDTILHPQFKGNLIAGNSDFSGSSVTGVRIKRREKGTYDWITIYYIPVTNISDINFERFHKYARNHVEYEFACVPMFNDVEGTMNVNSVISEFEGVFISDKYQTFHCFANVKKGTYTKNRPKAVITTYGNKHAFVISNGDINYASDSFSGIFVPYNYTTCEFDLDNGLKYRDDFMDFANNGKPKIIKYESGRSFLCSTEASPTETDEEGTDRIPVTTFSWVETGDINNQQHLYSADLIDVAPDSWGV